MAISPPSLPVKGFYYKTEVIPTSDGGLKTITSKSSTSNGTFAPVTSTIVDKTGKAGNPTFDFPGVTAVDRAAFSNLTSEESKSRNNQIGSTKPFGNNPTAEQQKVFNGAKGTPNAATDGPTPATPVSAETSAGAAAEADSFKAGTRKKYESLRYPENLSLETQDVIKFTILQYKPSLAGGNATQTGRIVDLNGIVKGTTVLGSITLPIPAGINDGNTVGWSMDTINDLQEAASTGANIFLSGGTAGEAAGAAFGGITKAPATELKDTVRGLITGMTVGNQNIMKRTQGATPNNNQELLFGSPGLRNFSFQFSFYPRGTKEAIIVRKIIRTFKQSMSVKRSETSLLLKSPHTFAIQYMTTGQKQHPYLNRFKECALTSCSVDYTPDGTYMTYGGDEKSMTAYRMTLQFGELEPLFDDEYGESDYDNVGF
jgi:hypothetical protein